MSTIKVSNLQNASAASPAIVLDANSRATLNGLSYPTEGSLSGRNRIINGDMRIDQRVLMVTTNGSYTVDRWKVLSSTTGAYQVAQSGDNPVGFSASLLFDVTTADTSIASTEYAAFIQSIEGFNVTDLAWGTASALPVSLSFWVKSTTTGTYCVALRNSAGNRAYVAEYTVSAANTWEQKKIQNIPGDTTGTWTLTTNGEGIQVLFTFAVGSSLQATANTWTASGAIGTANQVNLLSSTANEIRITGVQLEAGSVATPFERRSYGQELALCQRYYAKSNDPITNATDGGGTFYAFTVSEAAGRCAFPVPMRASPTIVTFDNTGTSGSGNVHVAASGNITGVSTGWISKQSWNWVGKTSGWSVGQLVLAGWTASSEL